MYLVVGLGNPGAKYAGNRHNIGFMAVDEIAKAQSFSPWRKKFQSEMAEGTIGGDKVLLLKPQTYMNESGRAVGEAMRFHQLDPDQVIVLYDEIDLDEGKVRVKLGGGAAGHNGIRSLIQHIGPHFVRVRLGVGHPGDKNLVQPHVLGDFSKADKAWLEPLLEGIGAHADLLLADDVGPFQSKLHLAVHPAPLKLARKEEM